MRFFLFFSLLFGACSAQAFDVTLEGGVQSSYVSSQLSSTPFDDKLVGQARDEAASFVASDGTLRGARLEAGLAELRRRYPAARTADDRALAEAILAW